MTRTVAEDGTILIESWNLEMKTNQGYYYPLEAKTKFETKKELMDYATKPSTIRMYKKHGIISVAYEKNIRIVEKEVPIII